MRKFLKNIKDRIKAFAVERLQKVYKGTDKQQAALEGVIVAITTIPATVFFMSIAIGPGGGVVGAFVGCYGVIKLRKAVNKLGTGEG